jgi:hypothetical protein
MVLGADANADAGRPDDTGDSTAAAFDVESIATQVFSVVAQRNSHCARQITGPSAKRLVRNASGSRHTLSSSRPSASHDLEPLYRLQGPNEHRRWRPLFLGHHVHQVMNPVIQIDVRKAWMSVQRLVALRGPGSGVASRIGFSNIGFNLDNGTGGEDGSVPMDEHLAKEVSSDFERGTVIESPRQRRNPPVTIHQGGHRGQRGHRECIGFALGPLSAFVRLERTSARPRRSFSGGG